VRRANLGRGFEETPVFRAAELAPGATLPSPAIVEETFTTIVVYPGWEARVDDAGDYLLAWSGLEGATGVSGPGRASRRRSGRGS